AWHALSLWWFDELDGRGPNPLYTNLKEHIETIKYIATTKKPVETNVPHHFAFRGADDVTYIISGFLAAKTAKKCGTKTFVLQNMLNTPRSTWGIQDLAKGRTLLKLVKELEDNNFRVVLQTRAGLDYFKPDLETAKVQLASVTAMMDDIDPFNEHSPDIIHVVSYCEALFLATPDILDDSIKITRTALQEYRQLKKNHLAPNVMTDDIKRRQYELETACRKIINAMEENIPDLYSPEGLYLAFVAGWLPTPDLWSNSDEFVHAKNWKTRMSSGGIVLCDHDLVVTTDSRINRCVSNMSDAQYTLKHKYFKGVIV
ncbi:cobalamin-binding protein, partial [bacterium]|nr:cobalamin-binding protein [bacterium]